MTGCGTGSAPLRDENENETSRGSAGRSTERIEIEIRAVNHRFLDVRVRVPPELPDLVTSIELLARARFGRGRFDVVVRLEGAVLGATTLDRDRARTVFAALTELRDELAPGAELPLSLLGSVPGLFVPSIERDDPALVRAVAAAFDRASASLEAMRSREGEALAADLGRRLGAVRRLVDAVRVRTPEVVASYERRLGERIARLRATTELALDPGRLEHEVALFADRSDVAEELTRLESHTHHFDVLLESSDAVGRRLDFLLQEMAREANTIGAKSQDVAIAHAVVELKVELERMREQVQNIE